MPEEVLGIGKVSDSSEPPYRGASGPSPAGPTSHKLIRNSYAIVMLGQQERTYDGHSTQINYAQFISQALEMAVNIPIMPCLVQSKISQRVNKVRKSDTHHLICDNHWFLKQDVPNIINSLQNFN